MKKNFIILASIGILLIFLSMAFVKNNINSSTWSVGDRGGFIILSVSWIAISTLIVAGMEDLKK
jgi:hypothetical protein